MARKTSNKNNSGNVGFEEKLWKAASILWGAMNPNNYKDVIFGLVFLKYISDRFQKKYDALKAEGYGDEEDSNEYLAEGIFYVPANARWSYIQKFASKEEIGTVIDLAMVAIESEYANLKGVLPKNYSNPSIDKQKLGDVVIAFSNEIMGADENDKDILGRTYEYFLSFFQNSGLQ